MSRLGTLLLAIGWALSALLPVAAQPAQSQSAGAPSLSTSLQQLESVTGIKSAAAESMLDRVSALEQKVFGQVRTGALSERIKALKVAMGVQPLEASVQSSNPLNSKIQQSTTLPEKRDVDLAALFPLVNVSPPRFVRIEAVNTQQKITGDYYPDVMKATKNRVFRFNTMPIPVYITPYPEKGFMDSCIKGFESWEEQTNGTVRFAQVDNQAQARISVIWSHLGSTPGAAGCTLGAHTITKWNQRSSGSVGMFSVGMIPVPVYIPRLGPKYSVPPQIIEVNLDLMLSKHPEVRYQIVQNVVTHELGHALGLLGHSPAQTDMMYPLTDEHSRLSPRDINTIQRVYQQKADVPL